jgi:hypothetical protein
MHLRLVRSCAQRASYFGIDASHAKSQFVAPQLLLEGDCLLNELFGDGA